MNFILNDCGPALKANQIKNIVGDFPNSEFFFKFYEKHNGGSPNEMLIMDEKKILSFKSEANYSVADFYKLTSNDNDDMLLFSNASKTRIKLFPEFVNLYPNSFPVARDMGDNEFWINKSNGNVLFFTFETEEQINDNIRLAASTFEEFINSLITIDEYENTR